MELQAELWTALERLPNSSCPAHVGGDRANFSEGYPVRPEYAARYQVTKFFRPSSRLTNGR
jgi:hypothetical protein